MKPILETERLILREFQSSDFEFIIELVNSPGWLRFIGDRQIKTEEQAVSYIINGPLKSYNEHGFGLSCVILKDTQTPIGMSGLIKRADFEYPDLGFAFLPNYIGQGFGLEIANAILQYASTQLAQKNILAIVSKDNEPSIALLNKLGFKNQNTITLFGETEELFLFNKTLL